MSKVRFILFSSFMVIGLVGLISSSISSLPFLNSLMKDAHAYQQELNKLTPVYKEVNPVQQVKMEISEADVEIGTHNLPYVLVEQSGADVERLKLEMDYSNQVLTVAQKNWTPSDDFEGFQVLEDFRSKDKRAFIDEQIYRITQMTSEPKIKILVPQGVKWEIDGDFGQIHVSDKEAIQNGFDCQLQYGFVTFDENQMERNLGDLNLEMEGATVHFTPQELKGFQNVKIEAPYVEIAHYGSNPSDVVIERLEIFGQEVSIEATYPFAKNLFVDGQRYGFGGNIQIALPFENMKTSFQMQTQENYGMQVELKDFQDYKRNEKMVFEYAGKGVQDSSTMYNIKVLGGSQDINITDVNNQ